MRLPSRVANEIKSFETCRVVSNSAESLALLAERSRSSRKTLCSAVNAAVFIPSNTASDVQRVKHSGFLLRHMKRQIHHFSS